MTLTSLGADAVGLNCSLGPREMAPALEAVLQATRLPVVIQPNAGMPRLENGETVYDTRWMAGISPERAAPSSMSGSPALTTRRSAPSSCWAMAAPEA